MVRRQWWRWWVLLALLVAATGNGAALAAGGSPWAGIAEAAFRPLLPAELASPLIADLFAEDASGFPIVNGEGGVARWDGYCFHLCTADQIQADGCIGASGHGILHVDAAALALRRLRRNASIPNSLDRDEVHALDRDRSGLIWVSTRDGPSHLGPRYAGLFSLFGAADRACGGTQAAVDTAKANCFSVEFSAVDDSKPQGNPYRYRMDGFDRDWIVTSSVHRVASNTNLLPGHSILELQGPNRVNVWTGPALTRHIHMAPAWFQSIGFRLVAAVAVILLIAALVRSRSIILRRRQRDLEDQVTTRTAELFETQQQLRNLAFVDALTRLPNRRAFDEEFSRLIETASEKPGGFALLLIDLDAFKRVNDDLGHIAGDDVLEIVSERLRNAIRTGDFVARLGGDEFAILLPGTSDRDGIDTLCQRIVGTMSAAMSVNAVPVHIGASVGVALSGEQSRTWEKLYRNADAALYEAKRAGGGCWRWAGE